MSKESSNMQTRSSDKNKATKYLLSSSAPVSELIASPSSPRIMGRRELPSVAIQSIMASHEEKMANLETEIASQDRILHILEEIKTSVSSNPITTENTPRTYEDTLQHVRELNDHFLAEKQKTKLNQEADALKRKFTIKWKNCLNKRNQFYSNHHRKQEKANLYAQWRVESPDYLPLKFRPHVSPNEREDIKETKISEAKTEYHNKITTMRTSADVNKAKFASVDEEMLNTITSESTNPVIVDILKQS